MWVCRACITWLKQFKLWKAPAVMGHNIMETTKNICAKDEGTVDHSPVTKWFKKFHLWYKNLDNQVKSGGPKRVDCKTVLQTIEANQLSSTWKVSGKFSMVGHLHDLGSSIQSYQVVHYITKILKNFGFTIIIIIIIIIIITIIIIKTIIIFLFG